MAGESEALTGYGTYVRIYNGATWFKVGELVRVTPPSSETANVQVTHMESPGRTHETKPTMITPGEMQLDTNYIPDNATDEYFLDWEANPGNRPVQIVYPNGKFRQWPCGFQTWAPGTVEIEDRLASALTLKAAGAMTRGTI